MQDKKLQVLRNKTIFFTIFQYDIRTLGPMMHKYCDLISEEGCILFLQNLLHSTYDLIIDSKLNIAPLGLDF